jgi:hypothetical protein
VMALRWCSGSPGAADPVVPDADQDEGAPCSPADAIARAPRQLFGGGTSISGAIDHAMTLFPATEIRARRVIDVSGDGANNRGRPPRWRAMKPECAPPSTACRSSRSEPGLDLYYRDTRDWPEPHGAGRTTDLRRGRARRLTVEIAGIELPDTATRGGPWWPGSETDPRLTPRKLAADQASVSRSWPVTSRWVQGTRPRSGGHALTPQTAYELGGGSLHR